MDGKAELARGAGYLSEESQRTFTLVAGVLGALFFILQFVVPIGAMFLLMPRMFAGMDFTRFELEGATSWRGAVYLVEVTERVESAGRQAAMSRLVRLGPAGVEPVVDLAGWKPHLVADGQRLWLIASDRMATFDGDRLDPLDVGVPRGDLSAPFLLAGLPAAVESRPDGASLLTWSEGRWTLVRPVVEPEACCTQFLAVGDAVAAFRQQGNTVYTRALDAPQESWAVVASKPSEWRAFLRNGRPAVIVAGEEGLQLLTPDGQRWRATALGPSGDRRMLSRLAALELEPGGPITLVTSGWPGSLRLQTWNGTTLDEGRRFGRGSPFPSEMMTMMWLPHLLTPLLSLVLALILSWLMRVHRVGVHVHEDREVPHASLTRRALSQLVDAALLGAPAVWAFTQFFAAADPEVMFGPGGGPLRFLGLMAGAVAWGFLLLAAFSVGEGWWGVTPGKWLTGIRVVGTDLRPCGFGRALVRNVLKLVDGFFNFLIGILMVAYTRDWQRLGDLAARTVVVRTPAGGWRALTGAGGPTS